MQYSLQLSVAAVINHLVLRLCINLFLDRINLCQCIDSLIAPGPRWQASPLALRSYARWHLSLRWFASRARAAPGGRMALAGGRCGTLGTRFAEHAVDVRKR